MWKRDEAVRLANASDTEDKKDRNTSRTVAGLRSGGEATGSMKRDVVNIGKSVVIKGELNGSEDLTIEGKVEGKIEMRQHVLTIGPNGKIKAQVFAKSVIVLGDVYGNITAADKVNIRETGTVNGDITAPRVAIDEGANFRGSIDMRRSSATQSVQAATTVGETKLTAKPETVQTPSVATHR